MKSNLVKIGLIAIVAVTLSGCVVAPPQPIGYRMTSSVLPTYVNGQYVGMQPSNYVAPATATVPSATPTPNQPTAAQTAQAAPVPTAPVYIQSTTPSVMYVQAPTPVYSYDSYYPYPYPYPYYSPFYANPWFGGVGIGIGGYGRGYYGRGYYGRGYYGRGYGRWH